VIDTEIGRLVKRGVVLRWAQGRYGQEDVRVEDLVAMMDPAAYLTGFYALHRHGLLTQVPAEITCYTNRRHNRSRKRNTRLGKFVFVCVRPPVYHRPAARVLAPPEQAFCDFLYLACRESLAPESLVTFRNLRGLKRRTLGRMLNRYPQTVTQAAQRILGENF
jgi:hypothetical protein